MFKRFLRHNKMLAIVLMTSAIVVLVLFIMLVVQYIKMSQANNKVVMMRTTIEDLLNTKKHKVAAVEGNLDLIAQDKKFYEGKLNGIKQYFGNPYYKAVDAMSKKLTKTSKVLEQEGNPEEGIEPVYKTVTGSYKDGYDLINHFKEFVKENGKNTTFQPSEHLQIFAGTHGKDWEKAMDEFIKYAQSASFEEINTDNCNEFFLFAAGFPRNRYMKENYTGAFLNEQKIKMSQYLIGKKIIVVKDAADFSLPQGNPAKSEIANVMFNLDVVGYLVKIIGDTKHNIKNIQDLVLVGSEPYAQIDGISVNHYKLIVDGSLESLRELTQKINESYKDFRVFKIKSVKLTVAADSDDGAKIMNVVAQKSVNDANEIEKIEENNSPFGGGRRGARRVVEVQKEEKTTQDVDIFDESELPYYERSTYGELVLGGSDDAVMEIELDYYYLTNSTK